MNKRGQFYLLGAIVIIVLIAGFASVSNYVLRKSSVKIYDVKDELGIESGKVLEYGAYDPKNDKTEEFIEKYEKYAGEDKEIYFIFGNSQGIKVVTYDDIKTGDIRVNIGGNDVAFPTTQSEKKEKTIDYSGDTTKVKVTLGEGDDAVTYTFDLKPGENFFFIIQQDVEGETHVATS